MEEVLKYLKAELEIFSKKLPARADGASERAVQDFRQQAEQLLRDAFIVREFGRELTRAATDVRERLESLQQLNVHLADRGLYQHILFPVSILDEMTEVQVKQFISGRGKKGRESLTAVLLLNLESIGRVRIDALLQNKALYVNVFLEIPELVPVAEELAGEFAEQLAARGFTLARFHAMIDRKEIDNFHRFDAEILGADESLIDLQA